MRRLVIFGDSFVEGFRSLPIDETTQFNFPYYLSKELDVEVINLGHRANSNLAIANDVLSFVRPKTKDELSEYAFLICWSQWERGTVRNEVVYDKNADYALRGHLVSRTVSNKTPYEHVSLRANTELSYLGIKQLCEMNDIPYRMINSYDFQPYLDRLDKIDCISLGKEAVSDIVRKEAVSDIVIGSHDWEMINSKNDPNWIESQSTYNTLLDMCAEEWLFDKVHGHKKRSVFDHLHYVRSKREDNKYITLCGHPNIGGNQIIARTLAPYLKEIIKV